MKYYRKLKSVMFNSRTFDFSEEDMTKYYFELKAGASRDRALASLLGCPKNKDERKFLKRKLSQYEYETLSIELKRKYPNR